MTSGLLPICGNRNEALRIRSILGFGATYRRTIDVLSHSCDGDRSVFDLVMTQLRTELSQYNTTYDPARDFVQLVIDLTSLCVYVNIAELGYYVNTADMSFTYLAMYLPVEYIDIMRTHAEEDEEMYVYMCDASKDREMWQQEKENPIVDYKMETRLPKIVSIDDSNEYVNVMLLRYPVDELRPLHADEINAITIKYIWVQIRPRIFGEKIYHVLAFMRAFMNKVNVARISVNTESHTD